MDDSWYEELIALAPANGIWCVAPDTTVFLICDRASGQKILGSPIFYASEVAEEHIRTTFSPDAAANLVIHERPYKDAHR